MEKEKKKVGRPKKELDINMIEKLASIFCTNEEISTIVGCHSDTLADNFSEYLKKGRDKGKMSLRRMQWEKCQTGNTTMLKINLKQVKIINPCHGLMINGFNQTTKRSYRRYCKI